MTFTFPCLVRDGPWLNHVANQCFFQREAFLLAPRGLPLSWAEAGCRGHATHLLRQVPTARPTRPRRGFFLGGPSSARPSLPG